MDTKTRPTNISKQRPPKQQQQQRRRQQQHRRQRQHVAKVENDIKTITQDRKKTYPSRQNKLLRRKNCHF